MFRSTYRLPPPPLRVGERGNLRITFRAPLLPSRRRCTDLPVSLSTWTGFAVITCAHQIEVLYEEALRPTGITVRDFAVLSEAAQRAGISQTALAERVGITRPRLSDHLARLEGTGYIERRLDIVDLRRRRIWLSHEGAEMLEEARVAIGRADHLWLLRLHHRDRPLFRASVDRLQQPHLTGLAPPGYAAAT